MNQETDKPIDQPPPSPPNQFIPYVLTEFTAPQITLTDEQQSAVDQICSWAKDPTKPKEFKLGGYAGTGKTTVIKTIQQELYKHLKIRVAAFTGKAVSVLERKHIYAQTLHSLLYDTEIIKGVGYVFHLKSRLDPNCDLIIIDEASMISTELYKALLSFNKKLLFVGDPGQLEPVGDNPNLMKKPDLILSKIHRQAEKSAILTLAHDIRLGGRIPLNKDLPDLITRRKDIQVRNLLSVTQCICAKNKTRRGQNDIIRRALGRDVDNVMKEDKIIILRNSLSENVFNGLILFITDVHSNLKDHWVVSAKDELGKEYNNLKLWKRAFQVEKLADGEFPPKGLLQADYGWVITCHKSQGSEWESVLVYDEDMHFLWDMRRWRYTAITRASEKLVYCI